MKLYSHVASVSAEKKLSSVVFVSAVSCFVHTAKARQQEKCVLEKLGELERKIYLCFFCTFLTNTCEN
jgi:hypothetical protein